MSLLLLFSGEISLKLNVFSEVKIMKISQS